MNASLNEVERAHEHNCVTIYQGDALAVLGRLGDASVNCVVTSPPYWRLRDYGVAGQLGLERTPEKYIEKVVSIFREVRRVLRGDGTCWVNLGDCYNSGGSEIPDAGSTLSGSLANQSRPNRSGRGLLSNLKPKDMVGIPWRVALAMQADGWWLRQDIIWSKPNPMPLSVTDRCTTSHEYIFLLTKSARYWYDAAAIRTEPKPSTVARMNQDVASQQGSQRKNGVAGSVMKAVTFGFSRSDKQRGHSRRHAGFNERWDAMEKAEQQIGGANRRSVWSIATQGYSEAHFATFPEEIPRLCILAGCPAGGVVLDPFLGSGTTAKVARELGRKAIGIELNPGYIVMAKRRLAQDVLEFSKERGTA